jgi:predicted HAD superfamily phosphohydrolase YqeG
MRGDYVRRGTLAEAIGVARDAGARSVVFDVEPVVASWYGSQPALDDGVACVLREAAAVSGIVMVCFATNSSRRPSGPPASEGIRVCYLASALKPFRLAPYQDFPRPGMLVGDQVLTDGLLARRLGYLFVHITPPHGHVPPRPWLLSRLGLVLRPLLFRKAQLARSTRRLGGE